jgi:hypothetical protein
MKPTYLSIVIEKELDDIVFEEYGYTYHNDLFEAKMMENLKLLLIDFYLFQLELFDIKKLRIL